MQTPSVATRATFIKQDSLFAYIYDSQRGVLLKMNVNESIESLLFDWEATPLAEITLNHHGTCFDIDFTNENLYVFDAHSDAFFKHDLADILHKL